MEILTQKFNLDLNSNGIQTTIDLREGDIESRLIIATLRNIGDSFKPDDDVIAVIRAKKPDGTIIFNNCIVDDGKVKFLITSQYAAVEGNYNACIEIIKNGVVLYSPKFAIHVSNNELSDSEVESSSEYTELTTALEQALTALELAQNLHLLKFVENLEDEGNEKYLYVLTSDYHYIPYVWDAENERYMELESNLEELAEFAYNLNLQKERIDNLLEEAVPGSTTRDLEVIDGRNGYDGRTYVNLGTAIREQIYDLHSDNTTLINNMIAADTNLNNIKANKSDVNTTTANIEAEIAVERARIDNISHLAEGSTTGDAELTDIRVGADGVTYSSAGASVRNQLTDLKDKVGLGENDVSDLLENNKIIKKNHVNCNDFSISNRTNWGLVTSHDSIKVNHKTSYTSGSPSMSLSLGEGIYVFHADFSQAGRSYFSLINTDTSASRELRDGNTITLTETTNFTLYYEPASIREHLVTGISITKQEEKTVYDIVKSMKFSMIGVSTPILINGITRNIIFPKSVDIVCNGVNYKIRKSTSFSYSYAGNGAYHTKSVYFDTSKLSSIVSDGFSNDCFVSRDNDASLALDEKYILIAIIPDSFQYNNAKPVAIFDYVTSIEENKSAILAKEFVNVIPDVQPLTGDNKLIDADAYDQFSNIIALWDTILTRANQYGTYITKCWIDGTAYDNSEHIMSDEPTTGEHNPRGDMNQYPLIMYKFVPANYSTDYVYKPVNRKILIVAGVHGASEGGDQLESPIAVYYFAKRLVEQFGDSDGLINIRNNYEIDFIPVANPWGINNKQRVNGQNVDINRDYSNFTSVTSQEIKKLIDNGEYTFCMDSHCLGGTSLTTGDLTGANFIFKTTDNWLKALGYQLTNYIGAKYSIQTGVSNNATNTLTAYSNSNGVIAVTTEIPANTPLYYGDTVGSVHSVEVVRRDVDYVQNVISVICDFVKKVNK